MTIKDQWEEYKILRDQNNILFETFIGIKDQLHRQYPDVPYSKLEYYNSRLRNLSDALHTKKNIENNLYSSISKKLKDKGAYDLGNGKILVNVQWYGDENLEEYDAFHDE